MKKNWNGANPDLGLLRTSSVRDELGKRGMSELRGHHCSSGSQAQERNEGRKITEVNVPLGKTTLKGKSYTTQGGPSHGVLPSGLCL